MRIHPRARAHAHVARACEEAFSLRLSLDLRLSLEACAHTCPSGSLASPSPSCCHHNARARVAPHVSAVPPAAMQRAPSTPLSPLTPQPQLTSRSASSISSHGIVRPDPPLLRGEGAGFACARVSAARLAHVWRSMATAVAVWQCREE